MLLARTAVAGVLVLSLSGCLFGSLQSGGRHAFSAASDTTPDATLSDPPTPSRPVGRANPLANGQRSVAVDEDISPRVAARPASRGVDPFAALARAEAARDQWQLATPSDVASLKPPALLSAKPERTQATPDVTTPAALIP